MKKVHLYGRLAAEFGSHFDLDVRSIAEAARALEANFPGRFFKALRAGAYHLVYGPDLESGESLDESMLDFRFGHGNFHVVPAVAGAGGGDSKAIATTVIGVVIIGAAIVASGGTLAAPIATSGLLGGVTFGEVAMFGVSLALSGVSALLTPTPHVPDLAVTQQDKNSFFFNGPVNVIQQGGPVRVVYGRMRVGSTVISSGLNVEQI